MRRSFWVGVVVAALPAVSLAAGPAIRCQNAKFRATVQLVRDGLNCQTAAAKNGGNVDATCASEAMSAFDSAFAEAEAPGVCATAGDATNIADEINVLASGLLATLRPASVASECVAAKLRAARGYSLGS